MKNAKCVILKEIWNFHSGKTVTLNVNLLVKALNMDVECRWQAKIKQPLPKVFEIEFLLPYLDSAWKKH